ncbi:MAG: ribosome small subunit-dependent GTPase A [Taibaiella sp.]|nr:ribosome small subunit-dependent GTPase A [Taibaiella sp.]
MRQGKVYKSTGNQYLVRDEQHFWTCILKGKLKIDENITSSNPIAVGDMVEFEIDNEETRQGIIKEILPRTNYIVRESPQNRKHQQHIIASNLDQAIIIATLYQPRTSLGFIDRFLVTAEAYHIPALIVFNKSDLYDTEDQEELDHIRGIYQRAGYEILLVSAISKDGATVLKEKLKGKSSLLSGHSGVGKSSIINLLNAKQQIKVREVSEWSGKGKHTTTFAEMMDLPFGGQIIDTPGVKEFGIVNIEREELAHYFPEMRTKIPACRFNNCMHLNEPGCAIKAGTEDGSVAIERYESYISILDSIPAHNY